MKPLAGDPKWLELLKTPRVQVVLVGFLALLLYLPTINHGYALDDDFLTQNYLVEEGLGGLGDILTHGYHYGYNGSNDLAYRPHILAMFTVERAIVGDNVMVHHFGNILLFALAGMMLTLLLQRMFWKKPPLLVLLVAILWISLPIHTEVVCSIKNREETLAFTYLILTLLFFIDFMKKGKTWRMALALFIFLLALMTKEHAITFLAVIPLMSYFFSEASFKKWALASLAFLIPAGIYMGLRAMALDDMIIGREIDLVTNSLVAEGHWELGSLLKIQVKYLQLALVPLTLSWDYSFNQIPLADYSDPLAYLGLILVLALLALGIFGAIKKRSFGFGILFYFITISLVSNVFFKMGTVMGERLLFTPSLGIVIFLVAGGFRLVERINKKDLTRVPLYMALGVGVLSLVFMGRGLMRQPDWKSKLALYESGIITSPNSAKAHLALSSELMLLGEVERDPIKRDGYFVRSAKEAQQALDIHPKYGNAFFLLGMDHFRLNRHQKAEEAFLQSVAIQPKQHAYNYLGVIRLLKEDLAKASEYFYLAIDLDENNSYERPWINLGVIGMRQGNFETAIAHFERANQINPLNQEAQSNLSNARKELEASLKAPLDSIAIPSLD